MNKKSIILLVLTIIFFITCYDDKGNYKLIDYNAIVKIEYDRSLTKNTVILGETIIIVPIITWKYPDRDTTTNAFEYRWVLDEETISEERILEYVPKKCANTMIYLYVTEKATKVVTEYSLSYKVETAYNVGWFILSEVNNRTSINFIRRNSRVNSNNQTEYYWTDYIDLYTQLHPDKPLTGKPIKATAYTVDYDDDEIIIFQEGLDPLILNGEDFGQYLNLKDIFMGGEFPNQTRPVSFIRGGFSDYVLANTGELYYRKSLTIAEHRHEIPFMDVPMYFPKGANITKVFDISIDNTNFILMYDELNKRMLSCYTNYMIPSDYDANIMEIQCNENPSEFANLSDLTGYELMYCGDHTNGSYFINILKEKSTGKYLYQDYTLVNYRTHVSVEAASQEEFKGNGIVTDNTVYWMMKNRPYLFFGEGSKLYYYDLNRELVVLYTDFGTGKITNLLQDANGQRLGISLDTGEFYLIDASSNEILGAPHPGELGILHHVSGLGDIKNLTWKWGGYFNQYFGRY